MAVRVGGMFKRTSYPGGSHTPRCGWCGSSPHAAHFRVKGMASLMFCSKACRKAYMKEAA
jgi:hypothetical protein